MTTEERFEQAAKLFDLPAGASKDEILKVANSSSANKAAFLRLFIGEPVTVTVQA